MRFEIRNVKVKVCHSMKPDDDLHPVDVATELLEEMNIGDSGGQTDPELQANHTGGREEKYIAPEMRRRSNTEAVVRRRPNHQRTTKQILQFIPQHKRRCSHQKDYNMTYTIAAKKGNLLIDSVIVVSSFDFMINTNLSVCNRLSIASFHFLSSKNCDDLEEVPDITLLTNNKTFGVENWKVSDQRSR